MRKLTLFAAMAAAASLTLTACGGAPEEPAPADSATQEATDNDAAEAPAASDFSACMVSDAGGFDDKSFNQSGYEGLAAAEDSLGIAIKTAESKDQVDYGPNIKSMVSQGCNLIITVGFLLADATKEAAEANPDSTFAIIDDSSITAANVRPLVFNTAEAAYLAGYVAAATSTTGTVATFGGMPIPTVTIFMDGFADGVARYNADKGGAVKLLGWDKDKQNGSFTGDFEDQSKGKNLTKTFIDQGADVVMPVAGPVGAGAAAAAKEAGNVAVVWVDADGYETSPDYADLFLTSVVKEIGASVLTTIKETASGGFNPEPYVGTLENGGVSIAPFHDYDSKVSAETKAEVEALQAGIISGQIAVDSPSSPTK
ncbi:MAG: BMP family ABC transporter substrate-binding protein [Bifidobacteriaceae bacterium]|jgi:basic membrane protein A|nr:BMP family ABC transporter substrate-binding protein [Bifidobacteriaceae bacterium]